MAKKASCNSPWAYIKKGLLLESQGETDFFKVRVTSGDFVSSQGNTKFYLKFREYYFWVVTRFGQELSCWQRELDNRLLWLYWNKNLLSVVSVNWFLISEKSGNIYYLDMKLRPSAQNDDYV